MKPIEAIKKVIEETERRGIGSRKLIIAFVMLFLVVRDIGASLFLFIIKMISLIH